MLRNYQRKPYWKLRTARITHWSLFFKKTIRQTRYKSFIVRYIKHLGIYKLNVSNLLNYFTYYKVSWTRVSLLNNVLQEALVWKLSDDIFSLPLLGKKIIKWKFFKKKNFRHIKKMGKWSYLGFKRFTCPWLQKKKKFPKLLKHLQPRVTLFKQLTQFDIFTNYIFFFKKKVNFSLPVIDEFKNNFFIKSHMFRYNASNKCS